MSPGFTNYELPHEKEKRLRAYQDGYEQCRRDMIAHLKQFETIKIFTTFTGTTNIN